MYKRGLCEEYRLAFRADQSQGTTETTVHYWGATPSMTGLRLARTDTLALGMLILGALRCQNRRNSKNANETIEYSERLSEESVTSSAKRHLLGIEPPYWSVLLFTLDFRNWSAAVGRISEKTFRGSQATQQLP